MTVSVLATATLAGAAPLFVGHPDDVSIAQVAWEAARACTGRDGSAENTVEIVRRTNAGDYLGVARTEPVSGRLYRIDLNTTESRRREVLIHEVSHAWVSEGPVALVEGTAERIADCVVARRPGLAPLQFDDGRDLTGMPDLLTWSKPDERAPSELYSVRTDAYVGASRLLRTAERVLPQGLLWTDHSVEWDTFLGALESSGSEGQALAQVMRSGPAVQRVALADQDRDGLAAIAEGWLGTSDQDADSDDDGWWDGAVYPADAVPVPLDGTPVCGVARTVHGDLRGAHLPELAVRRAASGVETTALTGSPPVASTGGWWVVPAPTRAGCQSSPRATVWAEDAAWANTVGPVHAALLAALIDSEARWELGPQRVAVALGGTETRVIGEVVWLATDDVRVELASGGPHAVARTAVAARRLWLQGDRDWTAVEALAASLAEAP